MVSINLPMSVSKSKYFKVILYAGGNTLPEKCQKQLLDMQSSEVQWGMCGVGLVNSLCFFYSLGFNTVFLQYDDILFTHILG